MKLDPRIGFAGKISRKTAVAASLILVTNIVFTFAVVLSAIFDRQHFILTTGAAILLLLNAYCFYTFRSLLPKLAPGRLDVRMIYTDELTGLYNYRAYKQVISSLDHYCLLIIDLDFFKKINDNYGHACGDNILKATASLLKRCTRETDLVFRYGGEEFIIILPHAKVSQAFGMAEKLRKQIEEHPFTYNSRPINITVSIGIGLKTPDSSHIEVFERADQALYWAKRSGRNKSKYIENNMQSFPKQAANDKTPF